MKKGRPSFLTTPTKFLDHLPLWIVVLLSLAGYCLLVFWFPLSTNYNRTPLLDILSFTPSLLTGIAYGLLFCFLFGLFLVAYRRVRRSSRPLGLAPILGVSFLFSLPLLLVYPINANDIYRYVIRGRVASVYGENPFIVAPNAHMEDPFLPFAGEWALETSPYGPIWELTASTMTGVTDDNLLLGLLSFKSVMLLAFAGTTVVLWALCRLLGTSDMDIGQEALVERSAATVLWAWNPALLFMFMIDGHNDVLMIFWLLLGLLVIKKGHPVSGFLLMMLGALTKPVGILALPIFFVSLLKEKHTMRDRLRFILIVTVGGLLFTLFSFMPFGSPLELVQRLMREAAAGGGFSPAALGLLLAQNAGIQLSTGSFTRLTTVLLTLFLIFALWLLWKTWQGRSPVRGTADIFFGYIFQALNFRIWYAAWPFPWLLLDSIGRSRSHRSVYRLHYGLWFLITSQLSVLIYGHIRIFALERSQFLAHILGVTFTFLLPFLLAWLSAGWLQDESEIGAV